MEFPAVLNGSAAGSYLLQTTPSAVVFYSLIVGTLAIVGTAGNILILASIAFLQGISDVENMFIFNLACSDILVTAFIDPYAIVGVIRGSQYFDDKRFLNETLGSICLISCTSSLLNIGFIAVNRYVYICHSGRYRAIFTRRRTATLCLTSWVVGVFIDIPAHISWGGDRIPSHNRLGEEGVYHYTVFFLTASVIIPLVAITVCYVSIFLYVHAAKRKLQRFTHESAYKTMLKTVQKARIMLVIFVNFTVCWSPYLIVLLTDVNNRVYHKQVHLYVAVFAHAHASGNFIIYGVGNTRFRKSYGTIVGAITSPYKRARALCRTAPFVGLRTTRNSSSFSDQFVVDATPSNYELTTRPIAVQHAQ